VNVLDLFSGIGGFSLGLERAGMRTVAFCEIEPYCRDVLKKHWPNVPCYTDVTDLSADRLAADGISVDVICGGFPCQDISLAGKGAGLAGERSGLWRQYARLIGELRPSYVIVENVSALCSRGLGTILGDLAALGYDAEWHCIPASYVGAPHQRDRIWVIAYPGAQSIKGRGVSAGRRIECESQAPQTTADDHEMRQLQPRWSQQDFRRWALHSASECWPVAWAEHLESLCRLDDGLSDGLDEECTLVYGNSVVPQIPELIGRAIMRLA
jgi:DNA (cytosine-5)-methyltransferase 1